MPFAPPKLSKGRLGYTGANAAGSLGPKGHQTTTASSRYIRIHSQSSDAIRGEVCRPREGRGAVVSAHSTIMSSEHEQQRSRLPSEHTEQPSDEPWIDLELTLPHNRSPTGIVSFVECALVELTHEDVGAEFVSTSVAGVKRTQFIAVDDVGQRFKKRYFDKRLGWHETTVSRDAVREELVNRLTQRSSLGSDVGQHGVVDDQDKFKMVPVREL